MGEVETSFLLDTGAELTSVMPSDGLSLGIDYSQLTGEVVLVWGVSGFIEATIRRAHILFTEDDGTYRLYDIDVVVMPDLVVSQPCNQKGKAGGVWSGRPGC